MEESDSIVDCEPRRQFAAFHERTQSFASIVTRPRSTSKS